MKFEARLTDRFGATHQFDFEADNNGLAADHIAKVACDDGMRTLWPEPPASGPLRAEYRRSYATEWHVALAVAMDWR
jgi:hypothetical protein